MCDTGSINVIFHNTISRYLQYSQQQKTVYKYSSIPYFLFLSTVTNLSVLVKTTAQLFHYYAYLQATTVIQSCEAYTTVCLSVTRT